MTISENEQKQLEVIVGLPIIPNGKYIQFQLQGSLFGKNVHYEYIQKDKRIELHLEGKNPNDTVRAFALYLEDDLKTNPLIKIDNDNKYTFRSFYIQNQLDNQFSVSAIGKKINELHSIIAPLLDSFLFDSMSAQNIINEIATYYENEKDKLPYNLNIIDELHANENAHTRILIKILQYKNTLKSFITKIPKFFKTEISKPHIDCFEDYFDGIIAEERKYAIIIENKICDAPNQNEQLERYIKNAKNKYNVSNQQIWVIYLTKDGTKVYETEDVVKDIIKDNYVKLNYRDDILPWLKNDILALIDKHEEILICALKQYIDHLEGLFGFRELDKTLYPTVQAELMEVLKIDNDTNKKIKYQLINKFQYKIDTLRSIIGNFKYDIEETALSSFKIITENYFDSKNIKVEIGSIRSYYLQIKPNGWPDNVHLEWIPFKRETLVTDLRLVLELHIENNNAISRALIENEDYKKIGYNYNKTVYYQVEEYLDANSFILLSDYEKAKLLYDIYEKFYTIVQIINNLL